MKRLALIITILSTSLLHGQSQNRGVASFFEIVSLRTNCMVEYSMDDNLRDLLRPNAQLIWVTSEEGVHILQVFAFDKDYPEDFIRANTYVLGMVNEFLPNDKRRELFDESDFAHKVIATGKGGCSFNRELEKITLLIIEKIDYKDLMENATLIELTFMFDNQKDKTNPYAIEIIGFTTELNHTIP